MPGRQQHAILGTTRPRKVRHEGRVIGELNREVVVAIFARGLAARPTLLRFPACRPEATTLAIEGLDTEPAEKLDGWRPSKTCNGLNVGDGAKDSAHIYWHRTQARFVAWSV